MAGFYDRAAATALNLITDKGKTVTLSKPDGGTFDPAEGKYTSTTAGTTGTAQAAQVPLTKLDDNRYLQELVEGKVRMFLIAASGAPFEPENGDTIDDGTDLWKIFGCTPVNPAGTAVLYKAKAVKI